MQSASRASEAELTEADFHSLEQNLRFVTTVKSIAEDFEARLVNALSLVQKKTPDKEGQLKESLREISPLAVALQQEWKASREDNEHVAKVVQQALLIDKIVTQKSEKEIMSNCVSLQLALSTAIMNLKKFLDKVLKEESLVKLKMKR